MSGRASLGCRISFAAAIGLSLGVTACTSAPDTARDLLAFEPGEAPAKADLGPVGVGSSLRQICALPGGRYALDRDLPGLTTRPEYPMFSGMTLLQLQRASGGRITAEDIARVAADLRGLRATGGPTQIATSATQPQARKVTTNAPVGP